MDSRFPDILSEKLNMLRELVSEAFTEERIDWVFNVFKLAPSNLKIWRNDVVEISRELNKIIRIFDDRVKEKTMKEYMLNELMLKSGYKLTDNKLEKRKSYYSVANGQTIVVLDTINKKTVEEEIIKTELRNCIALDKLFLGNVKLKTNTALQMKDAKVGFRTV